MLQIDIFRDAVDGHDIIIGEYQRFQVLELRHVFHFHDPVVRQVLVDQTVRWLEVQHALEHVMTRVDFDQKLVVR
jgi:hypothetical protein